MASINDIKSKIDKLTTQEVGETRLAPGQVAVAQSDIDALDAHVASLIDTGTPPAPPVSGGPPVPPPVGGPPAPGDPLAPPVA